MQRRHSSGQALPSHVRLPSTPTALQPPADIAALTGNNSNTSPLLLLSTNDIVTIGRCCNAVRPSFESILDTIFCGDLNKWFAHVIVLSYVWWHGYCGAGFIFALFVLHIVATADLAVADISEEEAVAEFCVTVANAAATLRIVAPRSRWQVIVVLMLFAVLDIALRRFVAWTLFHLIDVIIGPSSVLVIVFARFFFVPTLKDPYAPVAAAEATAARNAVPVAHHVAQEVEQQSPPALDPSDTEDASSEKNLSTSFSRRIRASSLAAARSWLHAFDPPPDGIDVHVHNALTLWRAPHWRNWKSSGDIKGMVHTVPWTRLKAGLYTMELPSDYQFHEVVDYICDDDGTIHPKQLHVFEYDDLAQDYIRIRQVDQRTRIVQLLWRRVAFCVSPRGVTMRVVSMQLAENVLEHYGVTNVRRVHVQVSSESEEVTIPAGYVRGVIHRHGIFIIEKLDGTIAVHMMLSAEAGGYVPAWILEIARGAQLKMLAVIRKSLQRNHDALKKGN